MPQRILLCDDEIHILRAAEFKLARHGYEVQCAGDGADAWELIQASPPHLLITDCQMPRMSGQQLCEQVRSRPELATLPIIMLTAKGFELDSEDVRRQWDVKFLVSKPFSPRELLQIVTEILGPPSEAEIPTAQTVSR